MRWPGGDAEEEIEPDEGRSETGKHNKEGLLSINMIHSLFQLKEKEQRLEEEMEKVRAERDR